jgi:hypothetical protein
MGVMVEERREARRVRRSERDVVRGRASDGSKRVSGRGGSQGAERVVVRDGSVQEELGTVGRRIDRGSERWRGFLLLLERSDSNLEENSKKRH